MSVSLVSLTSRYLLLITINLLGFSPRDRRSVTVLDGGDRDSLACQCLSGACVYYCRTYHKDVRVWGGETRATRNDEPKQVWTSLPITH